MRTVAWLLVPLAVSCSGEVSESKPPGAAPAAATTHAEASALVPIVDPVLGWLLGGARAGQWVEAEEAARAVGGGRTYVVYTAERRAGEAVGGEPGPVGEACPWSYAVVLDPVPDEAAIAIDAEWTALPRLPEVVRTRSPVDSATAASFLRSRGVAVPRIGIARVLRIDLDGNGTTEVLLSASHFQRGVDAGGAAAGDYSFVLVRRDDSGGIEFPLVAEVYAQDDPEAAPSEHALVGAFDLDGDGSMEVVVTSHYYEGASTTVFEVGEREARAALQAECGA